MAYYTARAFGWMAVLEAPNARVALSDAKQLAPSASLLPSDVTHVVPATQDDIDWHRSMS